MYDRDAGPGDDDSLGGCELPLSVLQPDVEDSHNIPLSKTTSGSVLLRATWVEGLYCWCFFFLCTMGLVFFAIPELLCSSTIVCVYLVHHAPYLSS